jgi:hypothetical protein
VDNAHAAAIADPGACYSAMSWLNEGFAATFPAAAARRQARLHRDAAALPAAPVPQPPVPGQREVWEASAAGGSDSRDQRTVADSSTGSTGVLAWSPLGRPQLHVAASFTVDTARAAERAVPSEQRHADSAFATDGRHLISVAAPLHPTVAAIAPAVVAAAAAANGAATASRPGSRGTSRQGSHSLRATAAAGPAFASWSEQTLGMPALAVSATGRALGQASSRPGTAAERASRTLHSSAVRHSPGAAPAFRAFASKSLTASASSLNFGALLVGAEYACPLRIRNTTAFARRFRLQAAGFADAAGCATAELRLRYKSQVIAPGLSTVITLLVHPLDNGPLRGRMDIEADDGERLHVALAGVSLRREDFDYVRLTAQLEGAHAGKRALEERTATAPPASQRNNRSRVGAYGESLLRSCDSARVASWEGGGDGAAWPDGDTEDIVEEEVTADGGNQTGRAAKPSNEDAEARTPELPTSALAAQIGATRATSRATTRADFAATAALGLQVPVVSRPATAATLVWRGEPGRAPPPSAGPLSSADRRRVAAMLEEQGLHSAADAMLHESVEDADATGQSSRRGGDVLASIDRGLSVRSRAGDLEASAGHYVIPHGGTNPRVVPLAALAALSRPERR